MAKWIDSANGYIPFTNSIQAVVGGFDLNGEHIYVGRAFHNDILIPGKVVPSHGVCYVAFNDKEIALSRYQVLTQTNSNINFEWVNASYGEVPTNALQGGIDANNEKIFIGRTNHDGSLVVGKIQLSYRGLKIPFAGGEHSYAFYECLVLNEN